MNLWSLLKKSTSRELTQDVHLKITQEIHLLGAYTRCTSEAYPRNTPAGHLQYVNLWSLPKKYICRPLTQDLHLKLTQETHLQDTCTMWTSETYHRNTPAGRLHKMYIWSLAQKHTCMPLAQCEPQKLTQKIHLQATYTRFTSEAYPRNTPAGHLHNVNLWSLPKKYTCRALTQDVHRQFTYTRTKFAIHLDEKYICSSLWREEHM